MITSRPILLGAGGAFAACAAAKPILLDRSAMGRVRKVGLPSVGFPAYPTRPGTKAVGNHCGAIGLIATAVVDNNRVDALTALMNSRGFDARDFFTRHLV